MASLMQKAAQRLTAFVAGPTCEPRKGTAPISNPRRVDNLTDGVLERERVLSVSPKLLRTIAEKDDVIVAIRRTLRFAIGELPWKLVPDLEAIKADIKQWQTIVELNLAMPGMDIPFAPQAMTMAFFTKASGALRDVIRDEHEQATDAGEDDSLENNSRLRTFFENVLSIHNVVAERHAGIAREVFEIPEPSNPNSSWRALSDRLVDDLTLFDAGAFVKNPRLDGRGLGETYTLPGEEVRLYRCKDRSTPIPPAIAYDQNANDQIIAIYNSLELGYLAANPQQDGYGKSPIEAVLDLMMMSLYGDAYTMDFFSNNNAPRGVFDLGPNIDQGERDAIETRWNNLVRAGIRRIMFVSNADGVKGFIPIPSDTNKDSEISELQKSWAQRKCAVFGLSPGDIGLNQDLHRSTAETSHDTAQSRGVNSFAKIIEGGINLNIVRGMMWVRENPDDPTDTRGSAVPIFPFRDVRFQYDYTDPTAEDEDADPQTKLLTAGILSINEVRKKRGEPPIPGGDIHTVTNGGSGLMKVADLKHLPPPQAAPDPNAAPPGDPNAPPGAPPPPGGAAKLPPGAPPQGNGPKPPAIPGGGPKPPSLPPAADDKKLEKLAKSLHALVVSKE